MRLIGEDVIEDRVILDMFFGLSYSFSELRRECIGFLEEDGFFIV